ncbi:HypC/HybG/HupF family hydrogenase formation chaperone [Thiorhodovibrio frisius]|uniref:Hydrogenase assembly chaperone HypC/HupF n=2 Tax=Thiorhodovibrio frisius TaxID=631362 RepID=H8YYY6_9GAMM|nr:HypC/HybG/HupF family hydrogenase formation chaperone [Thiorhodovibrio frisius]EIC21913.1 hydrogenase assembly chaperone HypC/HupF [Thiorhodovibrio frisius]WPL24202.1 hydrogenase assembly chaperone [Thiorhodovibrio frisius]
MCLGIPMQIKSINGLMARCEAKGVERDANLLMLMHEDLAVGDHIVVHLGRAIERVTAEDAATAWALYDEMLAAMDGGDGRHGGNGAAPDNLISPSREVPSERPQ